VVGVVGWPVEINGTQVSFLSSTTIFHTFCTCTMFAGLSLFYCGERTPQRTKIFHIFFKNFSYILKIYPIVKSGNPVERPNKFTVDWRCTIFGREFRPVNQIPAGGVLYFGVHNMVLVSCHHSAAYNFEEVPRFSKKKIVT